jgi:Brp/Blh family beta-carotene 15,15'-monooxygenase
LHLLFFFNLKKVIEIIYKITEVSIDENVVTLVLFTTMLLFAFSTIFIMMNSKKLLVNIIEEFFYLLILCLIFKSSSLIWGFTVYFVFWHSLPSLHDQITFLYGKFTFNNFKKYFKSAFIYWIISLIGIVLLFLFTRDWLFFDALFFSFLAAITFPHTLVIIKMYDE